MYVQMIFQSSFWHLIRVPGEIKKVIFSSVAIALCKDAKYAKRQKQKAAALSTNLVCIFTFIYYLLFLFCV